jgi:CRP-like cAMP-binding protein
MPRETRDPGRRSAEKRLLEMPIFSGLDEDAVRCVLEGVEYCRFSDATVFLAQGEPAEELYFLVHGESAVRKDGRLITLVPAPNVLGLVSLIDDEGRSASLAAFGDAEVFRMPRRVFDTLLASSTAFDQNVVRHLALELWQLYARNDTLLKHFDDFFESPNARLVAGPYRGEAFDQLVFVMEDSVARVGGLLPPGLALLPGLEGRYLITFNRFPAMRTTHGGGAGRTFAYQETAPFIPARFGLHRVGLFCPELYPDNYLAITLGRELYGFPKRFGKTLFTTETADDGALRVQRGGHVDLVMGGRYVLRGAWHEGQPLTARTFYARLAADFLGDLPKPEWLLQMYGRALEWATTGSAAGRRAPAAPVFVRREIPDVSGGRPRRGDGIGLEIDALTEVPFKLDSLSDFWALDGSSVRWLTDDWILGGRCVGAYAFRMSFEFGRATQLRNYRDESDATGLRRILGPSRSGTK